MEWQFLEKERACDSGSNAQWICYTWRFNTTHCRKTQPPEWGFLGVRSQLEGREVALIVWEGSRASQHHIRRALRGRNTEQLSKNKQTNKKASWIPGFGTTKVRIPGASFTHLWPWTSYLTSVSPSFLIHLWGQWHLPYRVGMKVKYNGLCDAWYLNYTYHFSLALHVRAWPNSIGILPVQRYHMTIALSLYPRFTEVELTKTVYI